MADFRRCLYALALVALLAGFTASASAQAFQCSSSTSNVPLVRAEGYAELLGDILLDCTGGIPTPPGQTVPTVNITVALDQGVNITSQVTATLITPPPPTPGGSAVEFLEALLIIDEPNSPSNPTRQLLNCGRTEAPDNTAAGAGVCPILTDGVHGGGALGAAFTYDGTNGHPNVFQGRSFRLIGGQANQMVFAGVPIDPPGTTCPVQVNGQCHRIIRITNIRGDATAVAVVSSTNTRPINASLNVNPFSGLPVDVQSKAIATVELGLSGGLNAPKVDFIQCSRLQDQAQSLVYTFQESFNNVFKPQSLTQTLANGVAKPSYANSLPLSTIQGVFNNQNVPGAVYDSESGFVNKFGTTGGDNPNFPLTGQAGAGTAFSNAGSVNNTNFAQAGIATQGTRVWLGFSSIPTGSSVSAPNVVNLTNVIGGGITGVAVLINGASATSGLGGTPAAAAGSTPVAGTVAGVAAPGYAVYEVFFANPNALEKLAIPLTVSGTPNLPSNLPAPNVTAQIVGSFAPFYTSVAGVREASVATATPPETISSNTQISASILPVPRFAQLLPAGNFYQINRCSCNLLFPYVTNGATGGGSYDTGIAIANTSLDPGNAAPGFFGFFGSAQSGPVQLWYFNKNNATAPIDNLFPANIPTNTQCTNSTTAGSCTGTLANVPAGGVLTYTLFNGGFITGATPAGAVLAPAPGFTGYIIAQARFQYCHGFAFISKQNAGLSDPANLAMGYLAIVLDRPAGSITFSGTVSNTGVLAGTGTVTLGLPRTASSPGENDGH